MYAKVYAVLNQINIDSLYLFNEKRRSVALSSYCYFLSNSFFIGVKYKKTNIAPEFAIPNPSSTYNSGSIALGGESKINTMNTINNIRYICFPILLNL